MEKDVYGRSLAAESNLIARGTNEQTERAERGAEKAGQRDSRGDDLDTEGNQIARGANEQAKQVEWGMIKAIQRDSRGDDLGTESNVMSHENVEKRTNKSKIRKIS